MKPVSHPNGPAYRLTGSGWVEGLDAAGLLKTPALMTRAQAVVKALKQVIEGRNHHHDLLIELSVLATNSGQTEEWCFNFHSGLLNALFPKKNMKAYWDDSDGGVRVPATIGQEPIYRDGPTSTSAG